MARTFKIHEANIERLEKKLNHIRNKCHKYGCDFHYAQVGETFEDKEDEYGNKWIQRYVLVEAEGTAVVNGWKFIATIDHTNPAGNILRKIDDSVEIPSRYYSCSPYCEHCKSNRRRKDTYVVYNNDTKEFKQVGSNCLCDFTGGYNAELAASYISMYDELIQGDTPYDGCQIQHYYKVEDVLRYTINIVNNLGYVSSSAGYYGAITTKNDVMCEMIYDGLLHGHLFDNAKERVRDYRYDFNPDFNSEELKSASKSIIDYIKSMEETSDYIHNLKVIAESEFVNMKNFGFCVSMIPCYNKYMEKVAEQKRREEQNAKEASESDYIGKEKDRIKITNISDISVVTSWITQYGIAFRYKIIDTNGNVIMWDASSNICDMPVKSITGTIKKLDEFRGVKQTWITRCRVEYVDDAIA